MSGNHFAALPGIGAWRLLGAHDGFEITQFDKNDGRVVLTGTTLGVEGRVPWNLRYVIELDPSWRTRRAAIEDSNGRRLEVEADGQGRWTINGKHDANLDGCLDLDLEGSVVTNTAPVHRMALAVGEHAEAPAAYVRAAGLTLERLEQTYERLPTEDDSILFDYDSPRFDYRDRIRFAADGLVIDYPNIGARVDVE